MLQVTPLSWAEWTIVLYLSFPVSHEPLHFYFADYINYWAFWMKPMMYFFFLGFHYVCIRTANLFTALQFWPSLRCRSHDLHWLDLKKELCWNFSNLPILTSNMGNIFHLFDLGLSPVFSFCFVFCLLSSRCSLMD
uniref:Calcium-transporting ATPase 3 endoplasmic reticulum-type n=1 Tax=Rhizophora mucronata TaxID=61149 RepID=A0A2P2M3I5_RHIMU